MAIGLPAYTCQMRTTSYFQPTDIQDIQDIAEVMRKMKCVDNPLRGAHEPSPMPSP